MPEVDLMAGFIEPRSTPPAHTATALIQGSMPVFVFGHVENVRVATVAINPGPQEFAAHEGVDVHWTWGQPEPRNMNESLSPELAFDVAHHYIHYFDQDAWRRDAFWRVNARFLPDGYSYSEGTACHLDISPWATTDVWSDVPIPTRDALLAQGRGWLTDLLLGPLQSIDAIFVRGQTATAELGRSFGTWGNVVPWQRVRPRHKVMSSEVTIGGRTVLVLAYNQFQAPAADELMFLKDRFREWQP